MEKDRNIFKLLKIIFKIGCVGFGGGTALIPLMEDEIVTKHKITTEEVFNGNVTMAAITPGALPVEIAAGVGYQCGGSPVMMASAALMALPGAMLTVGLLVLNSVMGDVFAKPMRYLSVGISAVIIAVLFQYVGKTVLQAETKKMQKHFLRIMLIVFLVTGEKNVYKLLGISATPIFSISTLQVLGIAFFLIFFTKGTLKNRKRVGIACVIAVCYLFCVGKHHLIPASVQPILFGMMLLLSGLGLLQSIRENKQQQKLDKQEILGFLACWLLFLLFLSLPAILIDHKAVIFIVKGFLSSLMSFGGGDAYLTIAQGVFVDGGYVSYEAFYSNIVTVANMVPGSILCKVMTGTAYYYGCDLCGSAISGILFALCGFGCSVTASGMIFMLAHTFYEQYENLPIIKMIKYYIRPIIAGLLMNVALSLYLSNQMLSLLEYIIFFGVMLLLIGRNLHRLKQS